MAEQEKPWTPKLSVIVPAHDEEGNVPRLMSELVPALQRSAFEGSWEIVLVDDNSTDRTPDLFDGYAKDLRVRCVHRTGDPGFGLAVLEGFKAAKGEYIVLFMADLSDDPHDLVALAEKAQQGYDVVYGSRFVEGGKVTGYPKDKMLANRAYNIAAAFIFGIPRRDITNAFKCYRRDVLESIGLQNIESQGFDITVELPIKAHILGFSSVEVPVTWRGRVQGRSKLRLATSGPSYARRLASLFLRGNLIAMGGLLGETMKIPTWKMVGSIVLSIVMLVVMFSLLGFQKVIEAMSHVSLPLWLVACFSVFLSFMARTWRWSVLLRSAGSVVRRDVIFSSLLFGWFVNYVLPARVGDLARAFVMKTVTANVAAATALSTILMERVMDVAVLAAFFGLSSWSVGIMGSNRSLMAGFALVFSLLAAAVVVVRFGSRIANVLPPALGKLGRVFDSMSKGVKSMLANREALFLSLSLSVPIWLLEVCCLQFSAISLGMKLPFSAMVLAATSAFIVATVPLTPGGIGIHEATVTAVLALFAVGGSDAMAVALVDHLARAAVVYLFGLISTLHLALVYRRGLLQQKG